VGSMAERSALDLDGESFELSSRRTGLSFQRTRMSADRTLMSVIRTSLALIGFGFTIFHFFRYRGRRNDCIETEIRGHVRNLTTQFEWQEFASGVNPFREWGKLQSFLPTRDGS
jgi:hypothetical protein